MIVDLKKNEKDSDFQVKLTLGAARIYQTQFNRDLFSDLYDLAVEINSKPINKALKSVKLNGKNIANLSEDELTGLLLQNVDVSELLTERPLTLEQCDQREISFGLLRKTRTRRCRCRINGLTSLRLFRSGGM